MNRCTQLLSRRLWLSQLAQLALLTSIGFAHVVGLAQTFEPSPRTFPSGVKRAMLTVTQPPEILLNSNADRLSPGARIHDTSNRLVVSGSLIGQNWVVNYTREPIGLVNEVWILTPLEASQALPAQP